MKSKRHLVNWRRGAQTLIYQGGNIVEASMVGQTGPPPKTGLVEFIDNCHTSEHQSQALHPRDVPQVFRLATRLGESGIADAMARYQGGESSLQLARSLGVSKSSIINLLRRRGVPIRQRRSLTLEEVVDAARLYESGLYLRQVAEHFDVSTEQVRGALRRYGLTMRDDRGGRRRRQ